MNHTGGGQRTRFGAGFGAQDLPWKSIDLKSAHVPTFWSALEDRLAVGGDFRFNNDSTFLDQQTQTNNFAIHEADVYIHAALLQDKLSFYADEQVAPNGVQSREIFGRGENMQG